MKLLPCLTKRRKQIFSLGSFLEKRQSRGFCARGILLNWEATVPKITVIIRKAYGGAFQAMRSKELGADQVWVWPTAEVAVMGAEGATEIVFAKEISQSDDPEATKEKKIEEYRRKFSDPYDASERLYVDAVFDPRLTRHYLKMSLTLLKCKKK